MCFAITIASLALSMVGLACIIAVLRRADANGHPANLGLIIPAGLVALALGVVGVGGLVGAFS